MNIVTPIPTAVVFPTGNVATESARRDNTLRETIPQTSNAENSAAESGVGSESDRVKTPGQSPQLTYERPQIQQNVLNQNSANQGDLFNQDNGEDPSAGRENAESRQQEQQQAAEQREVEALKQRDREVRAHEQAHASVGGQYAGSPSYEFESGPDGRQYAVGGEVSIDISEENTPEETVRKMQQVRAAALAPADPSPQDLRVASEATQIATEARSDIARQDAEEARDAVATSIDDINTVADENTQQNAAPILGNNDSRPSSEVGAEVPDLDDIIDGISAQPPTRSLDQAQLDTDQNAPSEQTRRLAENRDSSILRRVSVIENFYQSVAQPRDFGLQQSA
ncbi:MAG: putative metalloprotease CJM1_0395 family protein [Aliiglaciecola sp.]